ncbi:MAG: hypothetical protein AAF206_20845 [Bacteroidota bacterium]
MKKPTRRNRNIGTAKQGKRRQSWFSIPYNLSKGKIYYEALTHFQKIPLTVSEQRIMLIVERTRQKYVHPCTPSDLLTILQQFPADQLTGIGLIVLRQPKRKEQILSSVWGRYIYAYEFEEAFHAAIVLEAVEEGSVLKWAKKLSVDELKELEALRDDGHHIIQHKRGYHIPLSMETARNTQLYRTLPHEIGHHVHYQSFVQQDVEEPWEAFSRLPSTEKEGFAHQFANRFMEEMKQKNNIPFSRMDDEASLAKWGLDPTDFL